MFTGVPLWPVVVFPPSVTKSLSSQTIHWVAKRVPLAFIIGSSGKCWDDFIAITSLNSSYQKKLTVLFDVICKPLTADKVLIKSWLCVMELSTLRIHLNLKSPLLFVLAYLSSIPAMPQLAQMCCLEGEFKSSSLSSYQYITNSFMLLSKGRAFASV